jgi:hypothetical protein
MTSRNWQYHLARSLALRYEMNGINYRNSDEWPRASLAVK